MALTKNDFSKLQKLFYTKSEFDRKLDEKFDRKFDEKFDEKIKPMFDRVYVTLDKVMGELETIRDEVTLSASRVSVEELDERVCVVEQRLTSAGIS